VFFGGALLAAPPTSAIAQVDASRMLMSGAPDGRLPNITPNVTPIPGRRARTGKADYR
jgi:hypothetical protein